MKWCGHHVGFVLAVGRIQPMLELFETGSILGVILVPLFTMQWIWTCQYIAQVSLAYWYSVGMTILRSRVRIPVVALSFLFDSKHLYEAMIYWVYSCDYSLLEAPWSKLLALLDFIHISYVDISTQSSAHTPWLDFVYHNIEKNCWIVSISSSVSTWMGDRNAPTFKENMIRSLHIDG